MPLIDPYKTWQTLAERLETEKNPLHRSQLEKIIYHMKGEAAGDIDQILTTVSPEATYISYDNREGPPRVYKGYDEIRKFYDQLLSAVSVNLEFVVDRLVVADYCIITEGATKTAMRGSTLVAMGIAVDDPAAYYLAQGRTLVVWPFDKSGMILGEHIFPATATPLAEVAKRKLRRDEIGTYEEAA
jgi:hypothetical protein